MTELRHILAEGVTTVGADSRIELARWSSGNALLVGGILSIVGIYFVWLMYKREGRGLVTRPLRMALVACRVLVLMGLGFIGLEPVVVNYEHRRIDAQTIVLVDNSASMSLSDHYRDREEADRVESAAGAIPADGMPRQSLADLLLNGARGGLVDGLAKSNDVRVFSFGDRLQILASAHRRDANSGATQQQPGSTPTSAGAVSAESNDSYAESPAAVSSGTATDLGLAIRGAMDAAAGSPVAAIVMLSDGGFNRGEAPAVLARYLRQQQVPVFAAGLGDPSEPINARVLQLSAPRSAFKNDPFSVTVRVAVQGAGTTPLKLDLYEVSEDGARELAESRILTPTEMGRIAPAVFERKVQKPGVVKYAAKISPLEYEAVTSDNEKELTPGVRILDDKMRVLIVAGAPSYDYRFLARMLERDESVDVSTWLQSADASAVRDGDKAITELPVTLEKLNEYDAVILLDIDPNEFDPTWGSLIANYVSDYGGGVLYEAGNKYTGRFMRSDKMKSLIDILPVVPDPEAELVINDMGHYQTKPWPILVPDDAAGDPILQESDDPSETRSIWSILGRVFWHYPVKREKPVAHVLMRHTNPRMANTYGPHVLYATQYVGTGRTAWLGFNSSWRWRRSDERYFNRFWIQTLRFLVEGKLLGGRARGQILTSKEEYDVGESVVVTVRALDEQFNPLLVPELALQVSTGKSKGGTTTAAAPEVELSPVQGRDGYYEGRFQTTSSGTLQLSVKLPGMIGRDGESANQVIERSIEVSQSDIEMRNPAMNRPALQEFVSAVGGRSKYFNVDEAERIADLVPDMSRTFTVKGRPRPLWDNQGVLFALIGLLSLEWILRKKAKLL